MGGPATGVLKEFLLGGTTCAERTDAGLPAEVERTEGVWSIKFPPNYIVRMNDSVLVSIGKKKLHKVFNLKQILIIVYSIIFNKKFVSDLTS